MWKRGRKWAIDGCRKCSQARGLRLEGWVAEMALGVVDRAMGFVA